MPMCSSLKWKSICSCVGLSMVTWHAPQEIWIGKPLGRGGMCSSVSKLNAASCSGARSRQHHWQWAGESFPHGQGSQSSQVQNSSFIGSIGISTPPQLLEKFSYENHLIVRVFIGFDPVTLSATNHTIFPSVPHRAVLAIKVRCPRTPAWCPKYLLVAIVTSFNFREFKKLLECKRCITPTGLKHAIQTLERLTGIIPIMPIGTAPTTDTGDSFRVLLPRRTIKKVVTGPPNLIYPAFFAKEHVPVLLAMKLNP